MRKSAPVSVSRTAHGRNGEKTAASASIPVASNRAGVESRSLRALALVSRDEVEEPWRRALTAGGLKAETAPLDAGMAAVLRLRPEVVVLDATSSGRRAARLCRQLQGDPRTSLTPLFFVYDANETPEAFAENAAGRVAYVPANLSPREMTERIVAALRRRGLLPVSADICVGALRISPVRFLVFVGNRRIENLRLTEFKTLKALAENADRVLTREQILTATHGDHSGVSERSVDVQIVSLRRKLGPEAPAIETVAGVGYCLRSDSRSRAARGKAGDAS